MRTLRETTQFTNRLAGNLEQVLGIYHIRPRGDHMRRIYYFIYRGFEQRKLWTTGRNEKANFNAANQTFSQCFPAGILAKRHNARGPARFN